MRLTATGNHVVLGEAFRVLAEADQTEGRGGTLLVGYFSELGEAVAASRGRGVQGADGYIRHSRWVRYDGGLIDRIDEPVTAHRRGDNGFYAVGFVNGWTDDGKTTS